MAQLAREVVLGQTAEFGPHEFTRIATPTRQYNLSRGSVGFDADVEAATPLLPAAVGPTPPPAVTAEEASTFSKRVRIGINASWAVNILLLASKCGAFILSGSYAVLASAVDSLVDILSQAVLAVAEYQARKFDRRFPIGRTRMAELSVIACAAIMFISSALVVRESVGALWEGFRGRFPDLNIDMLLFAVLGGATVLKLALYIYCCALRKNPIMVALSEDHLNDVMSNVAAVAGAAVAGNFPRYWYADPAVALLFSLLIIRNWVAICWEQGQKMVGLEAPEELIDEVTQVTASHHPDMQLDRVTAYHHGSHMVVEVEVLLPADMTVRDSHDIALELQHKIEAIDSVERAFVHVDYARRELEEHKIERNLKLGERDIMKPLAGISPTHSTRAVSHGGAAPWGSATIPNGHSNGVGPHDHVATLFRSSGGGVGDGLSRRGSGPVVVSAAAEAPGVERSCASTSSLPVQGATGGANGRVANGSAGGGADSAKGTSEE